MLSIKPFYLIKTKKKINVLRKMKKNFLNMFIKINKTYLKII